MYERLPRPELQPYIKRVWASLRPGTDGGRELTLPNEFATIVVRLDGTLLQLIGADGVQRSVGSAVVSGIQTRAFIRERDCVSAVGAAVQPGAMSALTGFSAGEFLDRHVCLEDICNPRILLEQLQETTDLEARLQLFEAFLLALMHANNQPHPAVAASLQRMHCETRIGDMVRDAGMSHRHFNHLFASDVGLSPKYYQRLLRLNQALSLFANDSSTRWAQLALTAGYADQAHFNREFKLLTGMTPTTYARACRRAPLHVDV